MFEKLKKLLFDEGGEVVDSEIQIPETEVSDSLEDNKNLRKAEIPVSNSFETAESTVVTHTSSSGSFKRIDVSEPYQSILEKTKNTPKIEKKKEVQKEIIETKPVEKEIKTKPKGVNPYYYKPQPVISPMFGISSKDAERQEQASALSKPVESVSDKTIISPIYGQVTSETETLTKTKAVRKPRKRVKENVNMSLEEMLNIDKEENLEFTLFDVKVDKNEFKSREYKTIKVNKNVE